MKGITTTIFTRLEDLPAISDNNFFHSRVLFAISAKTPRMKPYMVVCTDESGNVLSQLLAIVRYRTSILPPYFFMHCRVMGEGEYAQSEWRKEDLLGDTDTSKIAWYDDSGNETQLVKEKIYTPCALDEYPQLPAQSSA